MSTDIAISDYLQIRNIAFEWSQSYDTKDWERLRKCLSPSTRLDFRSLQLDLHENLSPDDYVAILSGLPLLGSKRLKTQHFLGISKWERLDDGSVKVVYQIRVAHQRYVDDDLSAVAKKGHAHGFVTHWYRKYEEDWKLEGVEPKLEWFEYDIFGVLTPAEDETA